MTNEASNLKPTSVQWAVRCLWISVSLVLVVSIAPFLGVAGIPGDAVAIVTNLITGGLLSWVAIKVGAGRSWARWMLAVIFVLGSLIFVVSLVFTPEAFRSLTPVAKASCIVQFVLQGAALVFMFTRTSRQWFRVTQVPSAP